MSVDYYVGTDGPTIIVENIEDLFNALDILYTQVIDNISNDSPLLAILKEAIDAVDDERG